MVAALAVAAAACDSPSAPATPLASTPNGPVSVKPGGTLTFVNERDLPTFNLNTVEGASFHGQLVMDRVWPQVFLVNPQLKPVLDNELMQSVELINTNPQTIVYKINPAANWSDGVPISADDFDYNWRAQNGTGHDIDGKPFDVASTSGYQAIKSVTGSGNGKTVTVVFSQPYSDWESLFDNLVPAHVARRVGWNHGFDAFNPAVIISGGPFMVSSDSPGQSVTITRNPHYWGPPPNLDQIVFKLQPDGGQDSLLLQSGQAQMAYPTEPPASVVQSIKALPGIASQTNLGLTFEHLDFNQRNPFLADPKVRQAIAEATDRKELIDDTVGKVDPYVRPLNNHIFVNSQPGYQDNSGGLSYDLADAKHQLEQDGYVLGPDGYYHKGGNTLELRLSTDTDSQLRIGLEFLFIAQMKALGVKIDVANTDSGTLLQSTLPGGNFDLALFEWMATPFASATASIYQTLDLATGAGAQNYNGYSDPQVDTLFGQASAELNQGRGTLMYNQIDQQLWKDMVSLPLFPVPTFIAYSKSYVNIADNTSEFGPFWNAETWGIKAAPATKIHR
ncbi:MAG: ABC transporter family substrate-binding protein [Acidimicrobiales bacterium]